MQYLTASAEILKHRHITCLWLFQTRLQEDPIGSQQAGDLPVANTIASISKNGEAETLARHLNAIGNASSVITLANVLFFKL